MIVTSLQLSHFRSHRLTRAVFDGRPVAIVGPNGAGKTNILEAVSLLSPGRGLRRAEGADLARRPEALGWKVLADVQGLGQAHQIETGADGQDSRTVRIDGKAAPQTALGRLLRILWLVPAMDRLWIEAAEGRRRFLDRITLSFVPDHAEAVLTYDKAMRDRNRLLRDQVMDAHWYAALEGQMARAGAVIMDNRDTALRRLAEAQSGAETAFPVADLALAGPDGEGQIAPGDLAQALAESRRRDLAAGRTLVGPHRADLSAVYAAKGVAADQCSTGEQKALLISLILANARALAADLGEAPILLLDEVAAHLDETRRAALYDEIAALGAQALMTGTEQNLFDSLGARGQVFAVAEAGGLTTLTEVSPMTPQRVTLVTLGVADLATSKAFYARLGWREHGAQVGVAFYQMQGAVLALFGRADLAADQGRPDAVLGTGAMTLAQNFATEAEVDAAYALALSAGANALKAPEKVFWGGYSGYWADPDGHVWEVAMNPFWPLAADGSLNLPDAP